MPPDLICTDLMKAVPPNHPSFEVPITLPAELHSAGPTQGMLQLMMSVAYDSASLTARKYDIERREKDIDRRERFLDEQAEKARFMASAADAFKLHFSRS